MFIIYCLCWHKHSGFGHYCFHFSNIILPHPEKYISQKFDVDFVDKIKMMKGWSYPRPGLFKLNIVINYHMSCMCVRLKLYVNWKECILKISNLKSTNAAKTMFTNCVMCGHVDRSVVNSRHIRTLYYFILYFVSMHLVFKALLSDH